MQSKEIFATSKAASKTFSGKDCRLRLESKKLTSGKCQVKFYAQLPEKKEMYGYVLADANDTLKRVVEDISRQLILINQTSDYKHIHLFSLRRSTHTDDIMVFEVQ